MFVIMKCLLQFNPLEIRLHNLRDEFPILSQLHVLLLLFDIRYSEMFAIVIFIILR